MRIQACAFRRPSRRLISSRECAYTGQRVPSQRDHRQDLHAKVTFRHFLVGKWFGKKSDQGRADPRNARRTPRATTGHPARRPLVMFVRGRNRSAAKTSTCIEARAARRRFLGRLFYSQAAQARRPHPIGQSRRSLRKIPIRGPLPGSHCNLPVPSSRAIYPRSRWLAPLPARRSSSSPSGRSRRSCLVCRPSCIARMHDFKRIAPAASRSAGSRLRKALIQALICAGCSGRWSRPRTRSRLAPTNNTLT